MDKHRRYRSQSHRLPSWDYSNSGYYFFTLVSQHRECNLGQLVLGSNGSTDAPNMLLSDFGKIVSNEWFRSFNIRKELQLDVHVIMPNHLHAIVVLDNEDKTESPVKFPANTFVRMPQSLSTFISGFKSAVNSRIDDYIDHHNLPIPKYNRHNHFFQSNYNDRVIRNDAEYRRIYDYIINNPAKWLEDKFYQS